MRTDEQAFNDETAVLDFAKERGVHYSGLALYCWCGRDHVSEIVDATLEKYAGRLVRKVKTLRKQEPWPSTT